MNNLEDINELKRRNAELEQEVDFLKKQQVDIKQAKELYLKIFEEFPALIWRSGLDKLCDYFNKTWLDFSGRSMEQELGNGWAENVHPDDFDFCLKTYVEAFDKREAFVMEYRMKNKFGEYRWIRDFGRPFYDLDNSFSGYIGSCYDITEPKNNEQKLTELNAAKDKFFSIIAHDLKNPFHNILGYCDLLQHNYQRYDCSKMDQLIKELYNSAKSTYDLLENLLDWARSQSKNISFKPEEIKFSSLVPEIKSQVQSLANKKSIELKFNFDENLKIFADKNMLSTVLRNLLTNAVKFSYSNSTVNLYAENKNNEIFIYVEDFGTGIPDEIARNLFKIDSHHTAQGTRKEKGTGLGLILCKEFIEKHNGKIWVDSVLEKGSKFMISFPLQYMKNMN